MADLFNLTERQGDGRPVPAKPKRIIKWHHGYTLRIWRQDRLDWRWTVHRGREKIASGSQISEVYARNDAHQVVDRLRNGRY